MTQTEIEKACSSSGLSEVFAQYGSGFFTRLEKGRGVAS